MLLTVASGVIIWHVFSWHSAGKYDDMYSWLTGGNAYLTMLYDVGIMLIFGLLLGLLTSRLMEALTGLDSRGRRNRK